MILSFIILLYCNKVKTAEEFFHNMLIQVNELSRLDRKLRQLDPFSRFCLLRSLIFLCEKRYPRWIRYPVSVYWTDL